jgi:MoaA/NifB/PqqE/SkfB family radical SAM enzyme
MRLVALGFSCNNACVFCAQGELRASEPDESVASAGGAVSGAERVDNVIRSIEPGEVVAFVGGEPTIHERLPGWI